MEVMLLRVCTQQQGVAHDCRLHRAFRDDGMHTWLSALASVLTCQTRMASCSSTDHLEHEGAQGA